MSGAAPTGKLFANCFPQVYLDPRTGKPLANAQRFFYIPRGNSLGTLAPVYQEATLNLTYQQPVVANSSGQFAPIYLDPTLTYRSQLLDSNGRVMQDVLVYPILWEKKAVGLTTSTRVSNTTPSIDSNLQIMIPGPGSYQFDFMLEFTTAGAAGASPGVSLTPNFGGAFMDFVSASYAYNGNMGGAIQSGGNSINPSGTGATAQNFSLSGGGLKDPLCITGTLTVNGPGLFGLFWAQQTNSASTVTLNPGCKLALSGIARLGRNVPGAGAG